MKNESFYSSNGGNRIISFAQINELLNGFLDLWSDDPPVRPKMYNSPHFDYDRDSQRKHSTILEIDTLDQVVKTN